MNSFRQFLITNHPFFEDFFNVYTREAGAGNLSVAIEGPSKAKISIKENPSGFSIVSYEVPKEGISV